MKKESNISIYNKTRKGKTYEEIYGIEKAMIEKEKRSKSKLGNKNPMKKYKNKKYEDIYGIKKAPEQRLKRSLAHLGKKKDYMSRKQKGNNNISKRPEVQEKMRISAQKRIIKNYGIPRIGKNEIRILDELELSFNYKILRQYSIIGYWLDGYIPELNLAIEVDERYHNEQTNKDNKREQNIINKLNCDFVRIKDE